MFLCSRLKPSLAKVKFNNEGYVSLLKHIYVCRRHYGRPFAYRLSLRFSDVHILRGKISNPSHTVSSPGTNPAYTDSRIMLCPCLGTHYLQAPSALMHLGILDHFLSAFSYPFPFIPGLKVLGQIPWLEAIG